MSGWIKLHRKLSGSDLWLSEQFSRGQAWVDLLLLANHTDGFIRSNGMKIKVKRGQIGWSEVKLAERWKWSRGKVRRFLDELKEDDRIVQQKTRRNPLISVKNYNQYQTNGTTDSTPDSTTDGQRTDSGQYPKKNDKNEKKVKSGKGSRISPDWSPTDIDISYAQSKGFTDSDISTIAEKFLNYWMATTKNATKRDWSATWRNWVINEAERNGPQDSNLDRTGARIR